MFTGPNGVQGGAGMDLNGFAMSFSGVPGFNMQAMQGMMGGMNRGMGMGMGVGMGM